MPKPIEESLDKLHRSKDGGPAFKEIQNQARSDGYRSLALPQLQEIEMNYHKIPTEDLATFLSDLAKTRQGLFSEYLHDHMKRLEGGDNLALRGFPYLVRALHRAKGPVGDILNEKTVGVYHKTYKFQPSAIGAVPDLLEALHRIKPDLLEKFLKRDFVSSYLGLVEGPKIVRSEAIVNIPRLISVVGDVEPELIRECVDEEFISKYANRLKGYGGPYLAGFMLALKKVDPDKVRNSLDVGMMHDFLLAFQRGKIGFGDALELLEMNPGLARKALTELAGNLAEEGKMPNDQFLPEYFGRKWNLSKQQIKRLRKIFRKG